MTLEVATKNSYIKDFVKEHGADLLNYEKCIAIRKQLEDRTRFINDELDLSNTNSSISTTLAKAGAQLGEINEATNEIEEIDREIESDRENVAEVRKTIQEKFDELHRLQSTVQYMRVIQRIESLSAELAKEFANKDDERCATLFANLCEISRNLTEFRGQHLKEFMKETIVYWHDILKDKLVKDFDDVLKAIKWPFVNANFSLITPSESNVQKLQIISEYLLQIQLPDECVTTVITTPLLAEFSTLCLPIYYLVAPLRKRFVYHFYGGRQTNRVDKPEWYFTQILSWIRDHVDFVEKWIQPIIDKLGLHHIDAKLELMRGLVQLAVEKLHSELPNLQFDDFTFSHSVDEALGFDKELRKVYLYPTHQPSILIVLTQGQALIKWLAMEQKYAVEKMDTMLSPTSDSFQDLAAEANEYKITTCADSFVTLLQTIKERYESLPQPGHRLQFLDLQLRLLDDFRIRLMQLVNAETGDVIETRLPMIANTIYYIENVLSDWGNMLHYLNLFYYKTQLQTMTSNFQTLDYDGSPGFEMENETVFADTLSLYRHMRKDLLSMLAEAVMREVKKKCKNYRRERWSSMPAQKDLRTMSLTPAACPMFETLGRRLHQLQKSLANNLFAIVWRFIAQELDSFLFEELVLENRFSEGGAMQLKYDVVRNLFPLFSQFSERPENYYSQLKESCELLTAMKGSALLLRETLLALEGATGVEDTRGRALKEIGVVNFTPQMSVQILNRRADITIDHDVNYTLNYPPLLPQKFESQYC